MYKRMRLSAAAAVAVALGSGSLVALAGTAGASSPLPETQSARPVLHASLTPSKPTGGAIFGVAPGTVPWTIASGRVLLGENGTLQVNVARLIDPTLGDNPAPYIAATLYCAGTAVATTSTVPFSPQGNAALRAHLAFTGSCPAPAVLLRPAFAPTAPASVYIAYTGTAT